MSGVLKFSLGLNIAEFAGNAKKAEDFLENLTKSAKGGGGAFGQLAQNALDFTKSFKTGLGALGGAGGVAAMATGFGAALAAVEAIQLAMSSIVDLAESVGRKMMQAADHAAQLYYLSHRTQTSIPALYGLQRGAQVAGLSSDAPMTMMLKLQRALSGVSEEGERTDATFAQLNLNMDELRKMAPERQLMAVAHALHNANASARTGFASNLFGRFSFGDALQFASQINAVEREWNRADPGGQLFKSTAESFAQARGEIFGLKADMEIMFASAAKYLVEPFKDVMEAMRSFPWQGLGEAIGLSLKPVLEMMRFYANLLELKNDPQQWILRRAEDYEQAKSDAKAQSPDKQKEAMRQNMWTWAKGLFLGMPGQLFGGGQIGLPNANPTGPMNFQQHTNPFERMGFIFGNGRDSTQESLRRIATATERMDDKLGKLVAKDNRAEDHHELRNAP